MPQMYMVTAVSLREGGTKIAETQTVGFFDDALRAVVAVSDNDGWLQQELVAIEPVESGLFKNSGNVQWFRREIVADHYFYYYPINTPTEITNLELPLWRKTKPHDTCRN